jgi:hypothetical protein
MHMLHYLGQHEGFHVSVDCIAYLSPSLAYVWWEIHYWNTLQGCQALDLNLDYPVS